MSTPPWQFNPFTFFLDKVGGGGGGGGNITLTSQFGTPNNNSAFTIRGMNAGTAEAVFTSNTGSTFSIEDRTWDTPYVVDQSTTPGLRGTFSTIQAALDAAKADGMTFQYPRKILIRFSNSSTPFMEDLNIWSGAYFCCDSIGTPLGGAFVVPAQIIGNHTLDSIGVFYSQGVNWTAGTAGVNMFSGGEAVTSICASDSVFQGAFADGHIFETTGSFNCYFQNCDFLANFGDPNPFNCSNCSTVIFQACNFNSTKSNFGNGVIRYNNCQNIGNVVLSNNPVIAYDCVFIAVEDSTSCVTQAAGAGCEFYNCRFIGNTGGDQYALDGPGASSATFVNCFSAGLSPLNSGFYSPGTSVNANNATLGNILFATKVDADYTLTGQEGYVGVTDTSISQTITLRQHFADYQVYIADEGGNAGNLPIEIIDLNGGTINGQSSYFIAENFGGVLCRSIDGSNWLAMGSAAIPNTTIRGTGTSENAAVTTLVNFPLRAVPASYRFRFDIVGREATSGDTVGYTLFATAKTDGSAATIVATPFSDNDEDSALLDAEVDLVAVGNNVELQVTGVSATTIVYSAVGSYVVV